MGRALVMSGNTGARVRPGPLLASLCGRLLAPWRAWRDRSAARACCRQVLHFERLVANAQPWLERPQRYQKAVAALLAVDEREARALLICAQASFANWPEPRELTLRDVAHYLAVSELLKLRGETGVQVSLKSVVDATVPAGL